MQSEFAWLDDPRGRRSALRLTRTAVCRGWLSGPDQAGRRLALAEAIRRLVFDPTTRPREMLAAARVFKAMEEQNLAGMPRPDTRETTDRCTAT